MQGTMPHVELILTGSLGNLKPVSALVTLCAYLTVLNSVLGKQLINLLMPSLEVLALTCHYFKIKASREPARTRSAAKWVRPPTWGALRRRGAHKWLRAIVLRVYSKTQLGLITEIELNGWVEQQLMLCHKNINCVVSAIYKWVIGTHAKTSFESKLKHLGSCYGLNCVPSKRYAGVLTPLALSQNGDLFGGGAFAEAVK